MPPLFLFPNPLFVPALASPFSPNERLIVGVEAAFWQRIHLRKWREHLNAIVIEKRVKCFENTFFVFRFRRLVGRSPRRSVLGAGANAPLIEPDCTDTADSILPEDVGIVLIESVAIWSFRRAYLARNHE